MRIDELSVFVRVLEAGGFAAAARQLDMPTTTVSAKVAALERRLGVTLILRTTRKLRPTAAGQRYFDRCRSSLRELEAAEAEIAPDAETPSGRLRLTVPVALARILLPAVVARFRTSHPEVKVDIVAADREADLVGEGIDLALRVGPLRDSSLVARLFVLGSAGFFSSSQYLKRRGAPKTLDELAAHDIVGRAGPRSMRLTKGRKTVDLNFDAAVTCDDFNLARALIAAGAGIGYLPTQVAAGSPGDPPLTRVLPRFGVPPTGLYFVYPRQPFVPARVRAFIATALEAAKRGEVGGGIVEGRPKRNHGGNGA